MFGHKKNMKKPFFDNFSNNKDIQININIDIKTKAIVS